MKLLVDAHIGWLIIRFLEGQGHDVLRAASFPPATSDETILRQAALEQRVIVTSDKDFGELIFRLGLPAVGVILLRVDVPAEIQRLEILKGFWPQMEPSIAGYFLTVTAHRVRRTPLPSPDAPS